MSLIASLGAIEIGLIFGLVALGVYLSFRIINFPDLTVDGSFPLGGAVAAALIVAGWNPFAATAAAIVAGALSGYLTAWLNVRLRIMQLLASILVMIALYSINLRIMGKPNVALINDPTVFSLVEFGGLPDYWLKPLVLLVIVIAAKVLIDLFFASETGLAMRATGGNPRMARAQGISTDRLTVWGLALSNGAGRAGRRAVRADARRRRHLDGHRHHRHRPGRGDHRRDHPAGPQPGHHDAGLRRSARVLYRFFIALALNSDFIGLQAQDLNLVTAVLVAFALLVPAYKRKLAGLWPGVRASTNPSVAIKEAK